MTAEPATDDEADDAVVVSLADRYAVRAPSTAAVIRRVGPQIAKEARQDERAKLAVAIAAANQATSMATTLAEAAARQEARMAQDAERQRLDAADRERMAHAHGFHKGASWFGSVGLIIGALGMAGILTWAQTTVFDQAVDAASTRDMNDRIFDRLKEERGQ
jgi:hypothetical protein